MPPGLRHMRREMVALEGWPAPQVFFLSDQSAARRAIGAHQAVITTIRNQPMKTMLLIVIVLACVVVIVPALAKDYQVIRFGTDPTCPPFASKSTHA